MSTVTTRQGLVKPAYTDAADIQVLNTNYDTEDTETVYLNKANTVTSAFTLDASLASDTAGFRAPNKAGAVPITAGNIAYDSTAKAVVYGDGSATQRLLTSGTTNPGLTGATAASRWVGATTTGAPASGTFVTGDWVVTQDGSLYICTAGGSPGTWKKVGVATGTVTDYAAGTTDPAGGLLCDGRAVSRTTFAALFGVVGTTYGTGDGSTTFNIPDKRSRVWMGADNMGTAAGAASRASGSVALGNTSGADTHTLAAAELPATSPWAASNGSLGITDPVYAFPGSPSGGAANAYAVRADSGTAAGANLQNATKVSGAALTGSISLGSNAGGGTAMSLRQLSQIVNSVIWT